MRALDREFKEEKIEIECIEMNGMGHEFFIGAVAMQVE